jgi:endoglucanase
MGRPEAAPSPPRRGINFAGALDTGRRDDGGRLREHHYDVVRQAGFGIVRLPVSWSAHLGERPPYGLDQVFLDRVERAVERAVRRDLDVVLTVHHYDALCRDPHGQAPRFLALWHQIAGRFAGASPRLWFELLNEPHDPMTAEHWNALLADSLAVVRAAHPERTVIAGPVRWNTVDALAGLRLPADDHLTVTVHYYSPFRFTHQGASWIEGAEGWVGTPWGSATEQSRVRADLERAAAWAAGHGHSLFLGEFGAIAAAAMADRARWTARVRAEAERLGMAWAYWDYATDFGAYDTARDAWRRPLEQALLGGDG